MQVNTEKLRREMKLQGHTLDSFAKRLKVTKQAIGVVLTRKTTTLKTLTRIAQALDIDPKDLLI